MPNARSTMRGSPLSLGMGAILLVLVGCAGGDQSVSNNDAQTPPANGAITQTIGTVTDVDGNPLADVGIAVTEGTVPFPEILMLSGKDGKYAWSLPAGTFTLTANQEGYKPSSGQVVVKKGETTRLDFKLERM